jgi:hypothetical protein
MALFYLFYGCQQFLTLAHLVLHSLPILFAHFQSRSLQPAALFGGGSEIGQIGE